MVLKIFKDGSKEQERYTRKRSIMAFGGSAVGPPAGAGGPSAIRQVKLDKECELRIEVGPDTPLRLRLLTGTAEIFGSEIAPETWLTFPPRLKFAVYTWYGATVEMDGTTETDYTADETPMISYVNVHAVLEGRRNRAKASPNDSDSSQNWYFSVNADLYKVLVKELAQTLERQFTGNAEFRAAGMVINTMGWIEGVGYEPNVDVVKLQKSGGVVSRNAKDRQKARSYRIREYFYGLANDLSPHSNITSFSDLSVYRIGGGPQAPRSALPIGAEPAANPA
ncbi:unnamed protein product [Camellia sinensis]